MWCEDCSVPLPNLHVLVKLFGCAHGGANAFEEDAKVGLIAELRFREKQMGTTWSARQDMRIRYVEPAGVPSATAVASLENYRDL